MIQHFVTQTFVVLNFTLHFLPNSNFWKNELRILQLLSIFRFKYRYDIHWLVNKCHGVSEQSDEAPSGERGFYRAVSFALSNRGLVTTTMSFCPSTLIWNIPSRCWHISSLAILATRQLRRMDKIQIRHSTPAVPMAMIIIGSLISFWKVLPSVAWFWRPTRRSWKLTNVVTIETADIAMKLIICG